MLDRLTALFRSSPKSAEAWLARMGGPGANARDQAGFLAWLEADPDHLRQYEQAKAGQAALEPLRGAFAADLARLRRRRSSPVPRRTALAGGLAAAGVAAAVCLAPGLKQGSGGRLYESGPARIVDVALDDGTRVTLDADSAIRVALADDARRVTLERGSAYFDVAHDAGHPFQVAIGDRRVIVTGTRFVTTLTGDGAQVSLLEGRVVLGTRDVARADALDEGMTLSPGERAVFRPGRPEVEKASADVETATAWRKRRLVFQDAPLSAVVAAAARYSETPLVPADPALARIRVTAILPLEGRAPLADRMAALMPVRTERTPDGRVLIHAE